MHAIVTVWAGVEMGRRPDWRTDSRAMLEVLEIGEDSAAI